MNLRQRIDEFQTQQVAEPEGLPRTAVMTVRLPRSMHAQLGTLAEQRCMSMNRLCVLVLEQAIAELQPDTEAGA